MNEILAASIRRFLGTSPRFKLVVVRGKVPIDGVNWLDVGYSIGELLDLNRKYEPCDMVFLADALVSNIYATVGTDERFGKAVGIYNVGILFESQLDLSLELILSRIAKTTLVFLRWDGDIIGSRLYLLHEGSPDYINIKDFNHIII